MTDPDRMLVELGKELLSRFDPYFSQQIEVAARGTKRGEITIMETLTPETMRAHRVIRIHPDDWLAMAKGWRGSAPGAVGQVFGVPFVFIDDPPMNDPNLPESEQQC